MKSILIATYFGYKRNRVKSRDYTNTGAIIMLKAVSKVSSMTFVSRILGFIRDMLIARFFGASASYDAFLIAFKIPNFMRRLFAEGAFSQAFIPVLSEYKAQRTAQEVRVLSDKVFSTLLMVLLGVSVLGIIGAKPLIHLFAPGFSGTARAGLAATLLQITFPYLLLISLTAFAAGVLNTYRYFSLPAFTPVLLNIALIGAALWMSPFFDEPVTALAWGVTIGGILQLGLQLIALRRLGFWPRLRWGWSDAGVRKILRLMGPAVLGASVMQINLLVDAIFASYLPAGSISWLYYADRLIEFPLGMFGVALATVILPHLSEYHATQSSRAFSNNIDWALRWALGIGLPAAIGLATLRVPILTTLFQYGAFSAHDVQMASQSLLALSFGLLPFIGVKVLVSAFYAQQNTTFPFKVALLALASNVILNMLLIGPLRHAGLSLASSLSAWLNMSVLLIALWRLKHYKLAPGWLAFVFRLSLAGFALWAGLALLSPSGADWEQFSAGVRCLYLFGLVLLGGGLYLLTNLSLGMRPAHLKLRPNH